MFFLMWGQLFALQAMGLSTISTLGSYYELVARLTATYFVEAGPPKGTGVVEDMPWAIRAAAAVLESMGLASPVRGPECLGSWS